LNRLVFSLNPVPPFRLDLTAWAIRRRPENAIDLWDGEKYERVLAIGRKPVLVTVRQSGTVSRPRLEVTASGGRAAAVTHALERLLGLNIDLGPLGKLL
jgi:DNA-3-methyladenine glycosylase II